MLTVIKHFRTVTGDIIHLHKVQPTDIFSKHTLWFIIGEKKIAHTIFLRRIDVLWVIVFYNSPFSCFRDNKKIPVEKF